MLGYPFFFWLDARVPFYYASKFIPLWNENVQIHFREALDFYIENLKSVPLFLNVLRARNQVHWRIFVRDHFDLDCLFLCILKLLRKPLAAFLPVKNIDVSNNFVLTSLVLQNLSTTHIQVSRTFLLSLLFKLWFPFLSLEIEWNGPHI